MLFGFINNSDFLTQLIIFFIIVGANKRSPNAYEDDYTFDGDKEDSDTESSGPTRLVYHSH